MRPEPAAPAMRRCAAPGKSARPRRSSSGRRHVAGGLLGACAEQELLHLSRQVLACTQVGQIETVFVDQHGLVLEPGGPALLTDVVVDALAQLARIRLVRQALGFLFLIETTDGAGQASTLANACWLL